MPLIRHLFVPGLFGPVSAYEPLQWPPVPRLETVLARADRAVEAPGYASGLLQLFGIVAEQGADLPTAALALLGDTGERPPGYVFHADPLQLLPDRDQLLAFPLDDDPLDDAEIGALVAAFNAHFGVDGVRLQGSASGRLYLHCDAVPALRTYPLSEILGRNLDHCLPEGEDRRHWRGLLNETQMLCYGLDLNREREARGRPVLGGLWFSGGGTLPATVQPLASRVDGDCALARGLVSLGGGPGDAELFVERALETAVMRGDTAAWLRALTDLEGRLPKLLDGASLHLHAGEGSVFHWHARSARRWWRRRRSLAGYVEQDQVAGRGLRSDIGL
ncbi:MAG: phosphoglycerate mutase [Gammaproteobacteria bacterium]|nr:phosphoglycerate mutase [Gammaproteobacteria bacterium]